MRHYPLEILTFWCKGFIPNPPERHYGFGPGAIWNPGVASREEDKMQPISKDTETASVRIEETHSGAESRLLVVDDDPAIREILTDLLNEMGHSSETAEDGREAIEKIGNREFDLVLLDLVLPKISGQDTFETIRSTNKDIPIIIVTGHGSIESAVEFLKDGAVDYLTKPILFDEFRFRINRALEEKRLREADITDLKTELFNHSYFERRLNEELGRAKRYGHSISLLMLDLDNFKSYNDSYGHLAGDQVLRKIGSILRQLTRDCDIPCRFGGEEFSIILPETNSAGAELVAERIRNAIENTSFDSESPEIGNRVTASLGLASCGPDDTTKDSHEANSIIERADKALYKAKESGKNRICAF
jgi:diguanylate cyclase (GGDEF)-like protein